jgi:uncharacterized protein with ParB-like and HNH nuclease domain
MSSAISKNIYTNTVTMAELLANGRIYQVPPYQRDYCWREDNWEYLWNDIIALQVGEEQFHYMGAIVLQACSDHHFMIIDGQQRLTTLSLIAIAVIKRLQELSEQGIESEQNHERINILRRTYLGDKDPKSLLYSSKLFLNANNDNFYQSYILQLRVPPNQHRLSDTDKLLWSASQYFYNHLKSDKFIDGETLTGFLTEQVARKLLFIQINVENELSAYTVFETLNARGVQLSSTDLLKNYLFSLVKSQHDLKHIQNQWQQIANIVGTDSFPEFLRYYINSRQTLIGSQRLLKVIQEQIKSSLDVLQLLDELETEADIYNALFDATHQRWLTNKQQRWHIRVLRIFNIKQLSSLLLAAYRHFNQDNFTKVLNLCETIIFRYSVISSLNPNFLEKICNQAAIAIHQGKIQTPAQIFDALESVYINDEQFRLNFAQKTLNTVRHKKLVRYILFKLEQDAGGNEYDFEEDMATIEHILPENPDKNWTSNFPVDVQDKFIYRLGNYTLLEANINRQLKNLTYEEKYQHYINSKYAMTKNIKTEEWTKEKLISRQDKMAQRALHLWKANFQT